MKPSEMSFVQYYLQELAQLEDDCADFSVRHPQIAGNLGMGSEGATDPHVRQLIEAVAFIAARLKRQIDTVPGELAFGLLQSLAPHLVAPVPAMSVARFFPLSTQLDPVRATPISTLRLRATSPMGECLFSACARDIGLWPLQLECFWTGGGFSEGGRHHVPGFNENNGFVLRVEHAAKNIPEKAPGELTFFVSGALNRALAAVEAFMFGVCEIRMVAMDGSWSVPIPVENVEILGFDQAHRLVSVPHGAMHSGALVLEFLNFPRRFCFLKVRGLNCPAPARGFFLVFVMGRPWMPALNSVQHNIHLNCVPIVNLFTRPPVALALQGKRDEYIIPRADTGKGRWDVFSVDRVRLTVQEKEREIQEFHGGIAGHPLYGNEIFWQGVRKERISNDLGHASLMMRFVNLDKAPPGRREFDMAMLELTCTHCDAPEGLNAGQALELRGWDSGYRAVLEFIPTAYVPPLLPSNAAIGDMLKMLQWRSASVNGLTRTVQQYLAAHNRTNSVYASAAVSALREISRQVVAMPWPGMPVGGALGMGCQYLVRLHDYEEHLGSRYLLARIIRHILLQTHNLPLPMDVRTRGLNGGLIYVE